MRNRWITVTIVSAGLLLHGGCAAGNQMLSMTSSNMAGALKGFCEKHQVRTPETQKADSLYQSGQTFLGKGQKKAAYAALELAVIHYRLGLSKRELEQAERRLDEAKGQLQNEESRLADYRQLHKELKGGGR